ncbi:MAG: hypothetical protein ACRDBG_07820 [Waterburya sp.]
MKRSDLEAERNVTSLLFLREKVAIEAMGAIITRNQLAPNIVAKKAVAYADALIEELWRGGEIPTALGQYFQEAEDATIDEP